MCYTSGDLQIHTLVPLVHGALEKVCISVKYMHHPPRRARAHGHAQPPCRIKYLYLVGPSIEIIYISQSKIYAEPPGARQLTENLCILFKPMLQPTCAYIM